MHSRSSYGKILLTRDPRVLSFSLGATAPDDPPAAHTMVPGTVPLSLGRVERSDALSVIAFTKGCFILQQIDGFVKGFGEIC